MYTLAADEKATTIMLYSRNKLVHGDLVTNKDVRVSTWPRLGLPGFLHLWNAEVLFLASVPPKTLNFGQYFFPSERMIGYHLAPPSTEPLDYDPSGEDRTLLPIDMILGTFMLKGSILVSPRTELASMLEVSHRAWLSIYNADISNPFMPVLPTIHTPMLLVNPSQVSLGL